MEPAHGFVLALASDSRETHLTTEVLIPFQASTRVRCENMWRTVNYMRDALPGVTVRLVDDLGTPFSRAGSINHGVSTSTADIFVAVDADVLIPSDQLDEAIDLARTLGVVLPFDEYLASTPDGRNQILDSEGWPDTFEVAWDTGPTQKIPLVGACNVFSRETWETTGGLLELRGWGCQDVCWWAMCETFAAPTRRLSGPLVHLWHPNDDDTRRPRQNNPELVARSDAMQALLAVRGDRAAMRAELERLNHALPTA